MGFFHSPAKLFSLLLRKDAIVKKQKEEPSDWYFSKAGRKAFENATTPAQKTLYFFNYLCLAAQEGSNRNVLYKLAYVMSHSVENSSLPYAGYPDIIDPEKNPLVKLVKSKQLPAMYPELYVTEFLDALHSEGSVSSNKDRPYLALSYPEENGEVSDLYRIERDIIWCFQATSQGTLVSPYTYDIIKSNNSTEDDEI